jgi:hypothetical protein
MLPFCEGRFAENYLPVVNILVLSTFFINVLIYKAL